MIEIVTEQLQELGEKYGCPIGISRMMWIESRLAIAIRLERDVAQLRQIIGLCAAALPNGAFIDPDASIEFMAHLPNEISSVCDKLAAPQSSTSQGETTT